jgi:Na+-transporting methylmalonyl-CoA/oxaloacetate decarboxylase gamma subunit
MDEFIRFGSRDYCLLALLLAFSRSMDFLSTWIATPNLVLEGNPIAKKLGWRWGIVLNVGICFGMAFSPVTAIAVSTMSVLVAARNFQSAWLMRSLGEENYREWHVGRIQETRVTLYLFCLAGNTLLTAGVGVALIFLSQNLLIPLAIGMGIVTYAFAVALYTTIAIWRMRRNSHRTSQQFADVSALVNDAALKNPLADSCACETSEYSGK